MLDDPLQRQSSCLGGRGNIEIAANLLLLKQAVCSLDHNRLQKVETSDPEIVDFIVSDSIPYLMNSYGAASTKCQEPIADVLKTLLRVVGRDDIVIETIQKSAASPDPRCRVLAVSLLPLVGEPVPLRNAIFSLSLDRMPAVRCAVAHLLPETNFDQRTIDAVIRNEISDKSELVRNDAVELIPQIAPHLIAEFSALLGRPTTAVRALRSLPRMAENHGLFPFGESLQSAFKFHPNPTVLALLNCLEFLKQGEGPALLALIAPFMENTLLQKNISKFCVYVDDKSKLIELIRIESVPQWRDRMIVMEQCFKFIPFSGFSLVTKAIEFSHDEVAIVRDKSVHLWVALIGKCPEIAKEVSKLMDKKWQTRLVAVKIIGILGVIDDFVELVTELSVDPVSNVRYALAVATQGSEWFTRLFSGVEDVEIRDLF